MVNVKSVLGHAEADLLCMSALTWPILQGERIFLNKKAFFKCLIALIENEGGEEK